MQDDSEPSVQEGRKLEKSPRPFATPERRKILIPFLGAVSVLFPVTAVALGSRSRKLDSCNREDVFEYVCAILLFFA